MTTASSGEMKPEAPDWIIRCRSSSRSRRPRDKWRPGAPDWIIQGSTSVRATADPMGRREAGLVIQV